MFHLSTDTHRLTQHMPAHGPVRCLWRAEAALGEGALWSAREQALYWVDILGGRLHRHLPATRRNDSWAFGEPISAVTERAGGPGLLVALRSADDPEPLIAVGRAAGEITRERIGSNGFGFDPVMYLPEHGQTFAEMPTELKNQRSHRGLAARQMMQLIQERWLA